jgi:ferredoxin
VHASLADRVVPRVLTPRLFRRLWLVPPLLAFRRRRFAPSPGAWLPYDAAPPEQMRTVAGIRRMPDDEEQAGREAPYQDWVAAHPETAQHIVGHGWRYFAPVAPVGQRIRRRVKRLASAPAAPRSADADPAELTAALKAEAARLGISACGIAAHSDAYTYEQYRGLQVGDRVVICALETNYDACQEVPSPRSEKAQLFAGVQLVRRMGQLSTFLLERGYRVRYNAGETGGDGIAIHYGVAAGLGQLGMNGQLLTPQVGPRCRLQYLNTDAPLLLDEPVDYGIPKICDACQVCVRRCPAGAIPNRRTFYRGVEKARIKPERCVPVIAQVDHCAVCMKVCPVQRYGLSAVMEEFMRSGEILGKGTDELEAYDFEGNVYRAGVRPKLDAAWFARVPFDPKGRSTRVPEPELTV